MDDLKQTVTELQTYAREKEAAWSERLKAEELARAAQVSSASPSVRAEEGPNGNTQQQQMQFGSGSPSVGGHARTGSASSGSSEMGVLEEGPWTSVSGNSGGVGVGSPSGGVGGIRGASSLATLQELVRRKDGALTQLRVRLRVAEAAQVQATDATRAVKARVAELEPLVHKHKELQHVARALRVRHDAALMCIAEKDDEIEDLKEEMQHIQEVFRSQIDQLLPPPAAVANAAVPEADATS